MGNMVLVAVGCLTMTSAVHLMWIKKVEARVDYLTKQLVGRRSK